MKPHRVRMTHNLVVNYGLYRQMEVFRPKPISSQHMTRFHSDDYINFLRVITQDNMQVRYIGISLGLVGCVCAFSLLSRRRFLQAGRYKLQASGGILLLSHCCLEVV